MFDFYFYSKGLEPMYSVGPVGFEASVRVPLLVGFMVYTITVGTK
jgi:hypothetical protein